MRLDLGCGTRKQEGFIGVDILEMPGVDWDCDLRQRTWVFWAAEAPEGVTILDPQPSTDQILKTRHGQVAFTLADNSVDEVYCSHFLEHLTALERINFANELHRVMKPGAKATIIAPHWGSCRAYGDMTHQWPPVSEFWFYYLRRAWRVDEGNAPHDDVKFNPMGYSCDFDATWGYSLHPMLQTRTPEFGQFAIQFYKEAIQDVIATLIKRAP